MDKQPTGEKTGKKFSGLFSLVLENKAIFLLLILVIFMAVLNPVFFTSRNMINILRQISVSAIIGVGFTMIVASGNLDLSVGYMIGLIGVVTALVSKIPGVPFWLVIICGLLLGALCGFINGFIGTVFEVPLFISTLAMGGVYEGANYLLANNKTVANLPSVFAHIGQGYLGPIPLPVVIMVALVLVGLFVLNRMRFGRYVMAIGGNREASRCSGVKVNSVVRRVYIIMGVCAGVAALILTGRAASAQPSAGQGMEMDAIAAVVIGGTPLTGGKGKVIGTVIGCLIVGVINNGLNLNGVNSNWQIVVKGLLIVVAVVLDVQTSKIMKKRMAKA